MAMLNDAPHFEKQKNNYYTTKQMWKNISHLIPKNKIIWEACMMNSKSKSIQYWTELNYTVVGDNTIDCLEQNDLEYDMIITNPPFETKIKQKILRRLVEIDKPFIIVMNSMNIFTKYIREIFKDKFDDLQIIYPDNKIKFEVENEKGELVKAGDPSFYCVYVAYKMNIDNKKLYLK